MRSIPAFALALVFIACGDPNVPPDTDEALDSLLTSAELVEPASDDYRWRVAVKFHNTYGRARTVGQHGCSFTTGVLDGPDGQEVWPGERPLGCPTAGSLDHLIPPGDSLQLWALAPALVVQDSLAGGRFYLLVRAEWYDPERPPGDPLAQRLIDMGWITLP